MERIQSLQALRFFAATLVIVCHANPLAKVGAVGVDIFFVISGFIISRVATGKTPGDFIIARLTRIYPIYWLCAVPTALLATYMGAVTIPRTLTSLTLWPVFGANYVQPYLVLGWTLSFEMLFYACTALVLLDHRFLWVFAIAYPAAMLGAFITGSAVLRFLGNPMVLEFLMGVIIGRYTTKPSPLAGIAAIAVAIGLIATSAADRLSLPLNIFELRAPDRVLAWGIPAAMLVWGFLQVRGNWRVLSYLGDASYSIYLASGTAGLVFAFLPWPLKVIAVVAFGVATFRYIELPLLRSIRTLVRRVRFPTIVLVPPQPDVGA